MTVGELIQRLSTANAETEVRLPDFESTLYGGDGRTLDEGFPIRGVLHGRNCDDNEIVLLSKEVPE